MNFVRLLSRLTVAPAALALSFHVASADPCDGAVAANPPVVKDAFNRETYDAVYNAKLGKETDPASETAKNAARSARDAAREISLGDIVTVKGDNLQSLFHQSCANRTVILYLNSWPLTDVTPMPSLDAKQGELNFKLVNKRHVDGRDPWLPLMGSPSFGGVPVSVSLGFSTGFALKQPNVALPTLTLTVLPIGRFLAWAACFLIMLYVFWRLTRETTILRDSAPSTPEAKGPYSLSRSQGAVWFFVILAAFLFIGLITGDFSNTINSTALTLMGIGAGTVLGSAVIDAQKDTQKQREDILKATTTIQSEISSPPSLGGVPQDDLKSQLKKLKGESENFFVDIVSDANGVSFHRFQNAVWTFVLAAIFLFAVYQNLAMPEFNSTLLGLLGLSAGTYLGLKIPEPTTPTRPAPASGGAGNANVGNAVQGGAGGAAVGGTAAQPARPAQGAQTTQAAQGPNG